MERNIAFTKMEGIGNDYIYVDTFKYPLDNPAELAVRWSRPHTGIGSDGLVLIGPSEKADFRMRIFNADGSEALMCGNACRCIGRYVYERKLTDKQDITLETLSGIRTLHLHTAEGRNDLVTVDMGEPSMVDVEGRNLLSGEVRTRLGNYKGTAVSVGNPHLVIFTDNVSGVALEQEGPLLEVHPYFPDRVNVEFAQVLAPDHVRMRVWERGSGITQACGTGACATTVAAVLNKLTERRISVEMDGGTLIVEWNKEDGHILMTGGANIVFDGTVTI